MVSVLQIPPSDAEGRRFAERYTSSAEAFERFARALPLAEMANDDEDVTQAVHLFKEAVKLDGKFAMAWRQQGDLLFRQKQYAEAIEAYQAFLSVGRRNAVIYRRLGNAHFAQHDATRALDAYKRGLQLDGRDYQLHLDLGLAYAALRDYANATKTLLRALEVKPDDPLAFANLGVVYLLQGNFPAATASLRRAQLLQNSDPVLNYNLGLSLMFEQATDQAREQFERALQLRPDFAAAAYQLALISERLQIPQALERWRSYLALARGIARGTRLGGSRRRTPETSAAAVSVDALARIRATVATHCLAGDVVQGPSARRDLGFDNGQREVNTRHGG